MSRLQVLPVFFDLECTSLNANYGRLIGGCIKSYGEEVKSFRIDETKAGKKCNYDDSELACNIRDALEGEFQIFGYNSVMFDMKFLDSRLLHHGLRPTTRPMHKDLLFVAKGVFQLSDNRLQTVQEHLKLDTSKTRLDPDQWVGAAAGDKKCIDYVMEHCVADVQVLEEVFERLAPFVRVIYK